MTLCFFVFGSPRSGTTLIAQCLSAHPDIVVPNETDFIVPAAFLYDRIADPALLKDALRALMVGSRSFPVSLGEYLSHEEVVAAVEQHGDTLRELVEGLYGRIAERAGAQIAGDKSPNDLTFLEMVGKGGLLASPTRIIHVVRDIRDVLASIMEQGWLPHGLRQFMRNWQHQNTWLASAVGKEEQYLLIRYEDFVADPEAHLRRLLSHLDVAFHPAVLDPNERHRRYEGEPQHGRLYGPIEAGRVSSYKNRLDPELAAACSVEAAAAMKLFGYAAA